MNCKGCASTNVYPRINAGRIELFCANCGHVDDLGPSIPPVLSGVNINYPHGGAMVVNSNHVLAKYYKSGMTKEEWLDKCKEECQQMANTLTEEEVLLAYWMFNKVRGMTMVGIENRIAEKYNKLWKEITGK